MRLLSVILLAVLAASSPAPVDHTALSATVVADSMYDAGAIDSLAAYANRMMARASAQRDSVLLGRMIYYRGRARLALRDPHAPEDFARALEIATALNDSIGRMNALGLTAFVAVNQGHFDESIRLNEERIALARALHQRGSEGWGHLLIGYAELYREHFPRARDEYVEAWHAFHDANRPREQLSASIGLGRALELLGRYSEARVSYQQAWLTARRLGDRGQEADAINNLGVMEEEHGDLSLAVRYFTRAYEIKRDLKSFDIASVAHNLAAVDQMIGRYAHAESTLAQAMS
ncbi:MAG TPA: tetratricopeptide repeat protein, partial [Candidatus Krumholzibacteria bacterium]|nr:tetratricopeptide repeat protein [Candidatus Krumholzibacteria bacterium]